MAGPESRTKAEPQESVRTRTAVQQAYGIMEDSFYLCLPSKDFDNRNPHLLLSALTGVINEKQLIYGNIARAKTTGTEAVLALLHGIPKDLSMGIEARGDAEITKEEYIAFPDLADPRHIIFRAWAQLPQKIFDEFGRMPTAKHNSFLDAIDRGIYSYMNQPLMVERGPVYATCNWPDAANLPLMRVIADRFPIATIAEEMNPLVAKTKSVRSLTEDDLCDKGISRHMLVELSRNGMPEGQNLQDFYEGKMTVVNADADKFRQKIASTVASKRNPAWAGFSPPSRADLAATNAYVRAMPKSKRADLFLTFLRSEFTCPNCGEKDDLTPSCDPGCHFAGSNVQYAFGATINAASNRLFEAIEVYAKALAWFQGNTIVDVPQMQMILPYALWHRTEWSDSFMNEAKKSRQREFLRLFFAKMLVQRISKNFADNEPKLKDLMDAADAGDVAKVTALKGANDHPIFHRTEEYLS